MTTTTSSGRRTYGQPCPVAHSLDLVGERWTLLIVRDLMFGPLRFTDLRDGLPGLAPNLLSDRLRYLVEQGILEQIDLPSPVPRTVYALAARGRELAPVIHELARFGVADWPDPDHDPPPRRLLRGALLALMHPERLGATAWTAIIDLPDGPVGISVARRDVDRTPLARLRVSDPASIEPGPAHAHLTTSLGTLVELARGTLSVSDAERAGRVSIEGADRTVRQLGLLLGWE